jgi:hypothetical protein
MTRRLDSLLSLIGPHVMMVLHDSAREAVRGINQELSNNKAYLTLLNPSSDSTALCVSTALPELSLKRDPREAPTSAGPHWQRRSKGEALGFRRGPDTWVLSFSQPRTGNYHGRGALGVS